MNYKVNMKEAIEKLEKLLKTYKNELHYCYTMEEVNKTKGEISGIEKSIDYLKN